MLTQSQTTDNNDCCKSLTNSNAYRMTHFQESASIPSDWKVWYRHIPSSSLADTASFNDLEQREIDLCIVPSGIAMSRHLDGSPYIVIPAITCTLRTKKKPLRGVQDVTSVQSFIKSESKSYDIVLHYSRTDDKHFGNGELERLVERTDAAVRPVFHHHMTGIDSHWRKSIREHRCSDLSGSLQEACRRTQGFIDGVESENTP
jgi:hypothetical protein